MLNIEFFHGRGATRWDRTSFRAIKCHYKVLFDSIQYIIARNRFGPLKNTVYQFLYKKLACTGPI